MLSDLIPIELLLFCRSLVSSMLICLPSSSSLFASSSIWCLWVFLPLVDDGGAWSGISWDLSEEEWHGEVTIGLALLFFAIAAQVLPGNEDHTSVFSVPSSHGLWSVLGVKSPHSSISSPSWGISVEGIYPSSISKSWKWLLVDVPLALEAWSLVFMVENHWLH